ncbi:3-oxo-5-alpha-steroid 4 [Plasmopara halstedii]|uniref:3-oxo-5-alpha-steroid 4 n=1 Tax=Plasmopara halstedii TaxID=4781 RepID=A0A0P1AMF8_PLAHL|nr:3-oxo-5-alpha-steroid 4 [Plasmopara halstedii]CEG42382.1 3-oxo-5-alpha-steroid 4 [Plasmopara halstedii]|eukprot:XP_024578751.1 3-oxo-5-alpha-steroid 4 [Plasmopara halstedii]
MLVKVIKNGKSTKDYGSIDVPGSTPTVSQLKIAFEKHSGISRFRQSFKLLQSDQSLVPLTDDTKVLVDYGIKNDSTLVFRDLGPQIGYRTVFIAEYLGPLLFVLGYAIRPKFIYGEEAGSKPLSTTALLGVVAWSLHFVKRELETFFVHRFSRPTMPLRNLFKNCSYYWSFGAVVGYPLCHPLYTSPSSITQITIGVMLMVISEILNFCVHVQLRNMRPAEGSKERPIPKGFLFALVSCPNYTFEVLGWVGFSLFTQVAASYVFTLVGFVQMADWALKKHRGYLKAYGDEYKKLRRKAIIPFLL